MSLRRFAPLPLAGLLATMPAFAQDEITVFSNRPDSVAVTIYPDDLALITETRTVRLPESAATLVVRDVADTLLPQSAVVNGLARPLVESNFDFNRLSPQSLLQQAIGQTVTLTRTNPATGTVTRIAAFVRAAGEGIVLETVDGTEALYCSGYSESIVFDAIPDELYATPQLSMRIAAGDAGERMIQVSYLAHGFEWTADYVAKFGRDGEALDLTGWATVTNSSGKVFEQTELQLVAGQLNIYPESDGGSGAEPIRPQRGESQVDARERLAESGTLADALLLRECFEAEMPSFERPEQVDRLFETIVVTGARIRREEFGDYHLYRLPWKTDLGARQTKQLKFLELDRVTVERFYALYAADIDRPAIFGRALGLRTDERNRNGTYVGSPFLMMRTENTAENGLGEPLPAGRINFFEPHGESATLVGRSSIADRPVGAQIEFELGNALDLLVEADFRVDERELRALLAADYRAINDKLSPIDLEIRHLVSGETDLEVYESSHPYEMRDGYLVWRLVVPPGSETLSYRLSAED
jgi:hypothetical protein